MGLPGSDAGGPLVNAHDARGAVIGPAVPSRGTHGRDLFLSVESRVCEPGAGERRHRGAMTVMQP